MRSRLAHILLCAVLLVVLPVAAMADVPATDTALPALTATQRMTLAREFVEKISAKLKQADHVVTSEEKTAAEIKNLPDGEELLFQLRLGQNIIIQAPITATVEKGHINISLRDFVNAVDFPITYNPKTQTADGWYIREKKTFHLDAKKRQVITDKGTFEFSNDVRLDGTDDVYVPMAELAQWFGVYFNPDVSRLDLQLVSDTKLPVQEKLEREKSKFDNYKIGPASLPLLPGDSAKIADVPFVDVSTYSSYSKQGKGDAKPTTTANAAIRTSGDFAQGTLTTQSLYDKDQKFTNLRVNYKQESINNDLLGPLKARSFELGDINPVIVPLNDNAVSGLGARVTNADPDRTNLSPSTRITGTTFPGWDVELYRDNQLLGYQTVGDDGLYTFDDVDLYTEDNRFKVVLYGPQGEVHEEEVFVPVDMTRLSDMGSAYDVSVTAQDTQTYRKFEGQEEDRGAPNITAVYEMPIAESTAVSAGLTTRENNGDEIATAHAGISTKLIGTLFNVNTALDNNGEAAAELIARRKFDENELRNETRVATDKYGVLEQQTNVLFGNFNNFNSGVSNDNEVFGNTTTLNGPLNLSLGENMHYNLGLDYSDYADGGYQTNSTIGLNTLIRPFAIGQQLQYRTTDDQEDQILSLSNITGAYGKNRIRLAADYEIKPDSELDRVNANFRRQLSENADINLDLERYMETKLDEASLYLNWDAGFVNIAPGVTYNSDHDLIATLSTRFGLARDPNSGKIRSYDRTISSFGGASAFVYLDKNGNNVFDEGDEPIEGAVVKAPQNGSKEETDKDGYAFFNRMNNMRLTDIYLDPSSLADPFWIPGFAGSSIVPREGHVAQIEFPVHNAGEMDGTVYAHNNDGSSLPLRGTHLSLYDKTGTKVQSTLSESDGYYLFSKIPPGIYYLNVDDAHLSEGISRPLPQLVNIGYGGTTIYGNNVYLQRGKPDVPISILGNKVAAYGNRAKEFEGRNLILNLGTFKSQLAMGLTVFKLRTVNSSLFTAADMIQKPSEIIPEGPSQKYTLRLSFKSNNLIDAYKTCSSVVKDGNDCSVEVLPGSLDQEFAAR